MSPIPHAASKSDPVTTIFLTQSASETNQQHGTRRAVQNN
jgi:hypothetical protein